MKTNKNDMQQPSWGAIPNDLPGRVEWWKKANESAVKGIRTLQNEVNALREENAELRRKYEKCRAKKKTLKRNDMVSDSFLESESNKVEELQRELDNLRNQMVGNVTSKDLTDSLDALHLKYFKLLQDMQDVEDALKDEERLDKRTTLLKRKRTLKKEIVSMEKAQKQLISRQKALKALKDSGSKRQKCVNCRINDSQSICGQCQIASYCSKSCQQQHWTQGHKNECNL